MALPIGVQKVTVHIGNSFAAAGTEAAISGTISPIFGGTVRRAIWQATGGALSSVVEKFESVSGGEAFVQVPDPHQAGWVVPETGADGQTLHRAISDWGYRVDAVASFPGGGREAITKTFKVAPGQTSVDLDLVADGQVVSGVQGPYVPAGGAYPVQQVELTEDIPDYTLPLDAPLDQVISVVFTQGGAGGHTVTFDGSTLALASTGSTRVDFTPDGLGGRTVSYPASAAVIAAGTDFAAASSSAAAVTRPLLDRMKRGLQDSGIVVVGDSTGNEPTEWVYLLAQHLASQYPAYTVRYRGWNATTSDWDAYATIQTGTGTATLSIDNGSIPGSTIDYLRGTRWAKFAVMTAPDLLIINHGHNMFDPTGGGAITWPQWLTMAMDDYTYQWPASPVLMLSQNPSLVAGRETWQALKASMIQSFCAERGYGFCDVHQAFADTGAVPSYISADGIHPNDAGKTLWASVVNRAFTRTAELVPTFPRQPSNHTLATTNLALNSTFAAFTGATPDNWGATNCTTTKDTTTYETEGYGLKIDANIAAGEAYIEQDFQIAAVSGLIIGQPVWFAVRLYVPTSNTQTPSIKVQDDRGFGFAMRHDIGTDLRGRFIWAYVKFVAGTTTRLRLRIAPRISSTAVAASVTVDRVALVRSTPRVG